MSEMQKQESKPGHVDFCLFQQWKVQEHCHLILRNLLGHQLFYLWLQVISLEFVVRSTCF